MSEYFLLGTKKFVLNINLPTGYFLAQMGEYQQAPSGNPAVIVLRDQADTVFDDQWQLFLYAVNLGMAKNNVASLLGSAKALMNRTGIDNPDTPRENVISGVIDPDLPHPFLDKLRTFSRNTHAVRDYDDKYYQVWTMDGTSHPPMLPGKNRPKSLADIDSGMVKVTDYFYTPKTHLFAFLVCNNFNTKPGDQTAISPFAHGLFYDWTPSPNEIYTFFPLAARHSEPVLSPKSLWTKVSTYPNPYRRI